MSSGSLLSGSSHTIHRHRRPTQSVSSEDAEGASSTGCPGGKGGRRPEAELQAVWPPSRLARAWLPRSRAAGRWLFRQQPGGLCSGGGGSPWEELCSSSSHGASGVSRPPLPSVALQTRSPSAGCERAAGESGGSCASLLIPDLVHQEVMASSPVCGSPFFSHSMPRPPDVSGAPEEPRAGSGY